MKKFTFGEEYRITLILGCFRMLVLIVNAMNLPVLVWKVILGLHIAK
jgi:hypothetical protein